MHEGGRPIQERPIAAGSPKAEAVAAWLRSHPTGWRPSLTTYVPARYVRGEDFTLNFLDGTCVLNYRRKGDSWSQVVRSIDADDPIPNIFGADEHPADPDPL